MSPLDGLGEVMRIGTLVFSGFLGVVVVGVIIWQALRRSFRLKGG